MSYIEGNEFIFYKNPEGHIQSGGFSVESFMMKQGISPILTLNNDNLQTGGAEKVSDLFNNLVVPNWLVYYPTKHIGGAHNNLNNLNNNDSESDDEIIGGELHDKLLDLVTFKDTKKKNKKITRRFKNKIVKNKGSRKIRDQEK